MNKKIVIADASPLIAFGRIKKLSLLTDTLGKLIATRSVIEECISHPAMPGAKHISEAINNGLIISHENPGLNGYEDLCSILGIGEITAIILATQLKAGLLIDEKLGRSVASSMNLKMIGTAGVLLLAKEKKLIKKIHPVIQELKKSGYFLSDKLINNILKLARE